MSETITSAYEQLVTHLESSLTAQQDTSSGELNLLSTQFESSLRSDAPLRTRLLAVLRGNQQNLVQNLHKQIKPENKENQEVTKADVMALMAMIESMYQAEQSLGAEELASILLKVISFLELHLQWPAERALLNFQVLLPWLENTLTMLQAVVKSRSSHK